MALFFSNKIAQKMMSGFLAFWLTGLVFVFCCGMMEAPASVEFCPLAKAGSHCDKMKAETALPKVSDESGGLSFDCCGFLPQLFDKVRKLEKFQETARVPDKLKFELPQFSLAQNDFQSAEIYQPPIFRSSKIFIKNCVFRI